MKEEEFYAMLDGIIAKEEKKHKIKIDRISFFAGWKEAMKYSNSLFSKEMGVTSCGS